MIFQPRYAKILRMPDGSIKGFVEVKRGAKNAYHMFLSAFDEIEDELQYDAPCDCEAEIPEWRSFRKQLNRHCRFGFDWRGYQVDIIFVC